MSMFQTINTQEGSNEQSLKHSKLIISFCGVQSNSWVEMKEKYVTHVIFMLEVSITLWLPIC